MRYDPHRSGRRLGLSLHVPDEWARRRAANWSWPVSSPPERRVGVACAFITAPTMINLSPFSNARASDDRWSQRTDRTIRAGHRRTSFGSERPRSTVILEPCRRTAVTRSSFLSGRARSKRSGVMPAANARDQRPPCCRVQIPALDARTAAPRYDMGMAKTGCQCRQWRAWKGMHDMPGCATTPRADRLLGPRNAAGTVPSHARRECAIPFNRRTSLVRPGLPGLAQRPRQSRVTINDADTCTHSCTDRSAPRRNARSNCNLQRSS